MFTTSDNKGPKHQHLLRLIKEVTPKQSAEGWNGVSIMGGLQITLSLPSRIQVRANLSSNERRRLKIFSECTKNTQR
jgi:hypothetical protein